MLILVSGGTATLKRISPPESPLPTLGHLHTPNIGNSVANYWLPWAADNGAFNGFDPIRFLKMLADFQAKKVDPMWITCPDKVADHTETLRMFMIWSPVIRELGFRSAFVLQDGCDSVPWELVDAVFVGGSTEFKLSRKAARIVEKAKTLEKMVHMGRVNSLKRVNYAFDIGCNSIDGTSFSMFGDTYALRFSRFIRSLSRQKTLFADNEPY